MSSSACKPARFVARGREGAYSKGGGEHQQIVNRESCSCVSWRVSCRVVCRVSYLEEKVGVEERTIGVPVNVPQSRVIACGRQKGGRQLRADGAQEREAVAQDVMHALRHHQIERPHFRGLALGLPLSARIRRLRFGARLLVFAPPRRLDDDGLRQHLLLLRNGLRKDRDLRRVCVCVCVLLMVTKGGDETSRVGTWPLWSATTRLYTSPSTRSW